MRIEHRRSITWVVIVILLAQMIVMTMHHVAHGTVASPSVHADHSHGHPARHRDNSSTDIAQPSPCAFWLSLNCGAKYTPDPLNNLSVRPSSSIIDRLTDAPVVPSQRLLTHLSSRGPPRFG